VYGCTLSLTFQVNPNPLMKLEMVLKVINASSQSHALIKRITVNNNINGSKISLDFKIFKLV